MDTQNFALGGIPAQEKSLNRMVSRFPLLESERSAVGDIWYISVDVRDLRQIQQIPESNEGTGI